MGFGDAMARVLRLPGESVYSKALTIFVGFSIVLGTGVYTLTSAIILREFEETERQEMIGTLQRFTIVMSRENRPVEIALAESIRRSSGQDGNNLPGADDLATLQLDFISVANTDGKIEATTFRNAESQEIFLGSLPWPGWISRETSSPGQRPQSGFIVMGRFLATVAWQHLPDGSTALAGRIFGEEPTAFFEGMLGARLTFEPLAGMRIGEPSSAAIVSLLARNEFVVRTEGPDQLVGYALVRGINGLPIGQMQLRQARPLYREGRQAVQVFLTVLTLAAGALFLVVWVLLDRTILARIRDLTRKVEAEKDFGRLPLQLNFKGDDELGHLARRIENLAGLLDAAQANYRAVVEDQTESICRFSRGFALTFSNKVFDGLFPHDNAKTPFLQNCVPAGTFETLSARFSNLGKDREVDTFVHQLVRPGTQVLWFRSSLRASFDGSGTVQGGQWVAADITTQVQAQQQVQESERQLRSLSSRLLRLRDDEQRKIARELHDSTAQSLSALEMNMSLLEPVVGDERLQRIVAETRQIARDCCMELRNISYLLHPPLLDEVGLRFALQWFADGFEKRSSIAVTLNVDDDFPRLEPTEETALFRVVQEAMSNIYRHSEATHAWIQLAIENDEVVMELRDNGTGFVNPAGAAEGVGFAGMRERLADVGGKLKIETSPYGVSLTARLNFHPVSAEPHG